MTTTPPMSPVPGTRQDTLRLSELLGNVSVLLLIVKAIQIGSHG